MHVVCERIVFAHVAACTLAKCVAMMFERTGLSIECSGKCSEPS